MSDYWIGVLVGAFLIGLVWCIESHLRRTRPVFGYEDKLREKIDELEEQVRFYKREFESALERLAYRDEELQEAKERIGCLAQELEDEKADSKRFRDLLDEKMRREK